MTKTQKIFTFHLPHAFAPRFAALALNTARPSEFSLSTLWPLFERWHHFESKIHFLPLGHVR